MKRKAVVVMAMAALCTALAAGCQKTPEPSAGEETESQTKEEAVILDFTWWGNQVRNERTEAACQQYTSEHPDVTFRPVPINGKEYFDKVTTLAAGREMPDVLQQDYEKLNRYVEKGVINISNIPDTFLQSGKSDGSYYAFSMGVNAPCLVYDKTVMDQNGFEVKSQMTWDEFNELAGQVYEKTGLKTTYSTLLGPQHQVRISVRNAGKHVYAEDGSSLGFEDVNLVARVFALMENSIKEGYGLSGEGYIGVQTVEQCPIVSGQV